MNAGELRQEFEVVVEKFSARALAAADEVVYTISGALAQGSVQAACFVEVEESLS